MNLKRLLLLINLCLAGLTLWMVFTIVLTWRSGAEETGQPLARLSDPARSVGPSSTRQKKLKDYQVIIDRDIFDTGKQRPAKKEVAKVTELDLKLRGTVIRQKGKSFAIIEDGSTRKEELYSLDDIVQGARIVEILQDQVILNIRGRREALIMAEEPSPDRPKRVNRERVERPPVRPRRLKRPKVPRGR